MSTNRRATVAFRFVRAGNVDANPMTFTAKAGSAQRVVTPGSTFVTVREPTGLGHYFVTSDSADAAHAAFGLAQAVSARSEAANVPDLSHVKAIASLSFARGSSAAVNTQAGAEIGTVVDAIATTLRVGEWIAMAVREPARRELGWYRKWMEMRSTTGQHHSLNVNAVVVSVWAGGNDAASARNLLRRVSGSLPGFDLRTVQNTTSVMSTVMPWFITAAAAGVATFTLGDIASLTPSLSWLADFRWAPPAVAGISAGTAVMTMMGIFGSRASRIRARLEQGMVPVAGARMVRPRPPTRATTTKDGEPVAATEGHYPFASDAFLVGAHLPLAVIAPHAGAESGVASTKTRTAPPALRANVGPMIGTNDGHPVHLSAGDGWQGIMCIGQAGSGKSALLQSLWAWAMLDKMRPSGIPGSPGARHTMIALDTKGDGLSADAYASWSRAAGAPFVRFDVADETSEIGIELFPNTGSVQQRARHIVAALRYVYGETSIGPESFDTLNRVIAAGLVVGPDIASQIPGVLPTASPFYYANILLSNRGDDLGVELAAAIRDKAMRERAGAGTDLGDASEGLEPIYGKGKTLAIRSQLLKAPRTKVAALMAAEHWWARPRQVSWEKIITSHASIIINTGMSRNGHSLDKELAAQLSALIMYSLHEEIQRHCVGWFEEGRVVSIYADELKQIAGSSADVIQWIRNDARSFGVRAVFATQYPEQLEPEVRNAVMGFGTFISYAQQHPEMAMTIVRHLQIDGSEWTTADVSQLPRYEAIVRASYQQSATSAFTVSIPDFRSMMGAEYAAIQEFPTTEQGH